MQETLEGNVGGLENLIRNICASAWTFGQRGDGILEIKAGQLPDRLLMEVPFTVSQTAERVMIYRESGTFPLVSSQHLDYLRLAENIYGLCKDMAQENITAKTFDKLVYQNLTLYLDALMNKESPRSRQDKRLRFIEDVGKAIAAHYDLELNAEFAYLTGRYLTSLPLTPGRRHRQFVRLCCAGWRRRLDWRSVWRKNCWMW